MHRPEAFQELIPASPGSPSGAHDHLAHRLLRGRVCHLLQDYLRRRRESDSGAALAQTVPGWFPENVPLNQAGEPLLKFVDVSLAPNQLRVRLEWHADAGGILEQIALDAPGITDDRQRRQPRT